jgi:hypothetical protein
LHYGKHNYHYFPESAFYMKTFTTLACLAIIVSSASAATNPITPEPAPKVALPAAGYWQITASMEGRMGGGDPQVKKVCFTQKQLDLGFEKNFMEAVPPKPPRNAKGTKTNCQYSNFERLNGAATWIAACSTPFGTMTSQGKGTYAEKDFSGQQVGSMRSPMGSMKVTRKVLAQYVGNCPATNTL